MKKRILKIWLQLTSLIYLSGILLPISAQSVNKVAKDIKPETISKHIKFLASDSLLGRKTGSPEIDIAADYIASEFNRYGLEKINNSYFQEIPLGKIKLGADNSLQVTNNNFTRILTIKKDFVPYQNTASKKIIGNLVFAGYGITAEKYNYDDYKNIDVNGKIVLIMDHEPGENDSTSIFDGAELSEYANTNYKLKNAIQHGAIGLILVTDPINHILLKPKGFPWPELSNVIPDDAIPIELLRDKEEELIPFVHAGNELIDIVFGSSDSLKKLQVKIDEELTPNSFECINLSIEMETSTVKEMLNAKNVVGLLRGSDAELSKETLIIGAHYDHLGYIKGLLTETDSIMNGADDNASGTSGMLSIAEAFSNLKQTPKRSILFVAFTAEELGLFGSMAYVDNPPIPLENTIAMLNLDMISRNHPDTLILYNATEYPMLASIVSKQNSQLKTKFIILEKGTSVGSDHAPFHSKNIPSLFFFTGIHNDYHKVSDNSDKIDLKKASRVAHLCFATAINITNNIQK